MTYVQASLNNGLIARWEREDFPLPIFIEKCRWYAAKGEEYKYNDMVLRALKDWETLSGGIVRFRVIEKLFDSRVNLSWKRVDRKSLGVCKFEYFRLNPNRLSSAEVEIGLSDGIIHRQYMDDNEVYHTILHELGHAVGLGHSPYKNDIMYTPHQYGIVSISQNDIKTLEYIYNLPIGLSGKQLGERLQIASENFDEIIYTLEKRHEEGTDFTPTSQQQQPPQQGRNLAEENKRIADLRKYDMALQKINLNINPLLHHNIYKKPPYRH